MFVNIHRKEHLMLLPKNCQRLKDMGVETLWFMPVTPIAQKNKKGTLGSLLCLL